MAYLGNIVDGFWEIRGTIRLLIDSVDADSLFSLSNLDEIFGSWAFFYCYSGKNITGIALIWKRFSARKEKSDLAGFLSKS